MKTHGFDPMVAATVDFIVVGGGTAGALLANRLSADRKHSVLLLEAGGGNGHPWIHVPAGYLYCIDHPRLDWRFRTGKEPGLNGRSLLYPRGKTLGGCSSINGMIYMRGQARDYDDWAALTGDEDWSWRRVLPDFVAHESHHSLDDEVSCTDLHGRQGEWRVERQRLHWPVLDDVIKAAHGLGIPSTADFNTGCNEGVGYFEVNQRAGWRWNTTKAFLEPARHRENLTIRTRTHVSRLLLECGNDGYPQCVGVEGMGTSGRHRFLARREVILAAGAIGSPHLLQLSGIGPAEWLREAGLPVRHDLRGVGRNLQDHLQLRTAWRLRAGTRTLNTLYHSLPGRLGMGLDFLLRRRGPLSMAPSQLGIFTRSDASLPWPDLEFHVQPLTLPAFGQPLDPFPGLTASVCDLNPTSRGTVRVVSPDPLEPPAIAPAYLSTERDRSIAIRALKLARDLVRQPALAPYGPEEFRPGSHLQSDSELLQAAGDIGTTIFHPAGTTRMGTGDDDDAVVDASLRVRGIGALRVVDAGVMPRITSGNTASPTLMIAEKTARRILDDHR